MSKKSKMRWRKRDTEQLQKVINNFNARLYRQQKNNPEADYLPARVTKTEAVKKIETREDFNRLVSSLERFNAETAKKFESKSNAKMTQWAANEYKIQEDYDNKRKAQDLKRLKKIKMKTSKDKDTGFSRYDLLPLAEEAALTPTNRDVATMNAKKWERFSASMDKRMYSSYTREKKERWMKNYVRGMIYAGMPEELLDYFKHIDVEDFYEISMSNAKAEISNWYTLEEYDKLVANLNDVWGEVIDEKVNNDFINLHDLREEAINKWWN